MGVRKNYCGSCVHCSGGECHYFPPTHMGYPKVDKEKDFCSQIKLKQSVKNKEKEKNPDIKLAVDHYLKELKRTRNTMTTLTGPHVGCLSRMVKTLGIHNTRLVITRYLESMEKWEIKHNKFTPYDIEKKAPILLSNNKDSVDLDEFLRGQRSKYGFRDEWLDYEQQIRLAGEATVTFREFIKNGK